MTSATGFKINFIASKLFSDAKNSSKSHEASLTSAATITKRPLKVVNQSETPIQIENSKKLRLADAADAADAAADADATEENLIPVPETRGSDENVVVVAKRSDKELPTLEEYEALKVGRSPYFCVACDKSFSRSSIK